MNPYLWKARPDGIKLINIGKTWYGKSAIYNELELGSNRVVRTLGRRLSLQPGSSLLSITPQMSAPSQPVHMVSVLFSSLLLTLVLKPLPVVLPQAPSQTTSPDPLKSPASSSSLTPAPTLKPSKRLRTSTSQLLLFATLTPQPSSSTLPSQPTTRRGTLLVSSGGCWLVRSSD